MLGGTWLDQDIDAKAKFNWDKFANPGSGIAEGSAGNVWVIPTRSKQKDLAAEFINMTLSKKYQNELGSKGGLPLAADPSALTGSLAIKTNKVFAKIVAADGLGLYPDWPVAGYYDVLLKAGVQLLSDNNKAAYIKTTGDFYNQNKP
jgi:raffinose/stachyose/melibiose transport system substrate-binding protein